MIRYGKIKGVDKKVSRYIMGTAYITTPTAKPEQIEHLNDAFENGINTIDSAHSYGAPNVGSTEIALGKWLKESGIKREKRKKTVIKISKKVENAIKFDNIKFRKNNYIEIFLDEELMEKEPLVGISYQVDKETIKIIKDLDFTDSQKENLFNFVKDFGTNISILKIIKIDNLCLGWIPSFRSAILIVNRKKEKFYYDIENKIVYNLNNKEEEFYLDLKSKYYLIIFANKNMIA